MIEEKKLPVIAFCTTCKGRTQHLEQTLPKNIWDNKEYANAKFIVLDYNSHDNLIAYLLANHKQDVDSGRLVVYSFVDPGPFRMAHAKNMAHRLGIREGADILVNMDADNFTMPHFAEYIAEQFSKQDNTFMWAKMIKEGPDRLPRGCSGRIIVTKHQFLNVGGYDERFNTWAPDDKDFNARLRRIGYEAAEIDRQYIGVIAHNDKMRFREYPEVRGSGKDESEFELVNDSDATIVNFGKFGNGTVFRNFTAAPITLENLPTRIFGIGLHKTGTTSLHAALQILGYDSAHWKSAHWAKAIWMEMNSFDRSATLEKHYALTDLPICILYEKLDKAYPGSKFILTLRNEEQWLKSVKNHWDQEKNKFRNQWNADPFTHIVHKAVYGQKNFDAEIFLARFRRHNVEVKEYFKNRPNDLLVMDISNGVEWMDLCQFLNQPIPNVDYPKEFATRV